MGKFIDLSGQVFGSLTVIERAEDHVTSGGNRFVAYNCVCVCGRDKKVVAAKLKNGHTGSCGQCDAMSSFIDLTGQRFDKLVVTRQDGWYIYPKRGDRDAVWLCRCDCGNEITVYGRSLRRKGNHSCNCYRSEYKIADHEMVEQRFGKLTVLERAEDLMSSVGTKVNRWLCSCDCGTVLSVRGANLRNGKARSCGCYRLEMLSGVEYMSKSEQTVVGVLDAAGLAYEAQKVFSGLIGLAGNPLSYDFCVVRPDGTYLIECQGAQHYGPVEFFGGTQGYGKQQVHDHRKRQYAEEQGMGLLEINCSRFNEQHIVKETTKFLSL